MDLDFFAEQKNMDLDFFAEQKKINLFNRDLMIKNMDNLHFENPSGYEDLIHYRVFESLSL